MARSRVAGRSRDGVRVQRGRCGRAQVVEVRLHGGGFAVCRRHRGLTGAPPTIQLVILFAAACGFLLQAQFRPQMFCLVLLGELLALLARDNYRRDAWLWLAVPLMALWANLHGGFFIGTAALALYSTVAALDDLAAGAGWRRGAQLSLLTIVAVAATPVNPYGVGMWETVAHALGNPFTRNAINDWQPFWWAMLAQWHSASSSRPHREQAYRRLPITAMLHPMARRPVRADQNEIVRIGIEHRAAPGWSK
jgi:hypothetical protein